MKTLYLHIGTVKTGTTSIQRFLFENREFLNKHNIHYPTFNYAFEDKAKERNGLFLDAKLHGGKDKQDKVIDSCIAEIEKNFQLYDKIVLSDEILFWTLGKSYKSRTARLIESGKKAEYAIKVIVYLRRQDELVESHWNQLIKKGVSSMSFEEFKKDVIERERYDYEQRIRNIEEIFGKENIIVRRYQKDSLKEGDSLADFLSIIGITDSGLAIMDTAREYNANQRINNTQIYIKRVMNNCIDPRSACMKRIKDIMLENNKECLTEEKSCMSEEEAREFMASFKNSNDAVAIKYIQDGKPLFSEKERYKEKWELEDREIMEELIRISTKMFAEMKQEIEEQKEATNKLKKWVLLRRIIRKLRIK